MRYLIYSIIILSSIHLSIAQTERERQKISSTYDLNKLLLLNKTYSARYKKNKSRAYQVAKSRGVKTAYYTEDSNYVELQGILPDGTLLFYQTSNVDAAFSTRTNHINTGGSLGFSLDGQNMVAYVWDGGHPRTTHQEYDGPGGNDRVTLNDISSEGGISLSNHATHVTGTICAAGLLSNGDTKGMAPHAQVNNYKWNADLAEATLEASDGMLISNHSYGLVTANLTDNVFGAYMTTARDWDNLLYNAPYYLMVTSAGNEGNTSFNESPLNPLSPEYDKLSYFKVSKNNIVVANAQDANIDSNGNLVSVAINSRSSQGPTDDYRIKPDITGNGTGVLSSTAGSDTATASISGTSMASPNVSGSLLLLQQHYNDLYNTFMRASTLKGLVLHTADDAGMIGPDANFGWGLLNAKKAAETLSDNSSDAIVEELDLTQGETFTIDVSSNGIEALQASISWTDPAGLATTTLNDTSPVLINDLDIQIKQNTNTYHPWRLTDVNSNANDADNIVDNFERVDVDNANGTYTISITHKGTLTNNAQNYSLIVTGITNAPQFCKAPNQITATNITSVSAEINWNTPVSSPSNGYDYFLTSTGIIPDENTTPTGYITQGMTSLPLNNLSSITSYQVFLRSDCSGDVNVWSEGVSFNTPGNNPNFTLDSNGVTCLCPNATFGEIGTLTINGEPKTFTKRTRAELDVLIAKDINDPEIALTCTTGITDMSDLFRLTLFNQDISFWDVSNVTDMSFMFFNAPEFDQPLNSWNVSSVTNMLGLFGGFDIQTKFNQPLNNWDVSNVINMSGMFQKNIAFNQNINNWDVSKVTNMSFMFLDAISFNQSLNDWNVSSVTNMQGLFFGFDLQTSFNEDISNWCVSNFTSEPSNFSSNSTLYESFKPLWGENCVDNTWLGTSDTDWNNAANWELNILPNANDNVALKPVANLPEASTDIEVNNLIILEGSKLEVQGVLKTNNRFHNNGILSFHSDNIATAQFDEFTGTISGSGEVTVERYIPQKRAFRLLSSPVTTTDFIYENWQQNGLNPGDPGYMPNLGTQITGGDASLGFDQSGSNNPSMFTFDNATQSWQALPNTNATALNAEVPYLTMVRGDRGIDLTDNLDTATETTLSATGDLFTGPSSPVLSTGLGFYSLIANPYQAVVDYSLASRTDLTDFIYVWDANIGGTNGNGGYVTVDVSSGATIPPSGVNATKFIAPGMSFFVQNPTSGTISPSLTFNESNKATGENQVEVFSSSPVFYINSKLFLTSDYQNGHSERDAIGLRFSDNYTTLGSDEDGTKLGNPDENYAVVNNGLWSIDKQAVPSLGHEIDFSITNYTETNYSLTFVMENKPEDLGVFLKDEYLGTQTELTESFVYDFSVDQNISESIVESRFSLIFDNTTLGVNESTFGENFSLYPNPTSNGLFSIKTPSLSGKVDVEITNLLGQQVYKQELSVESQQVDVNAKYLSAGVYIVEMLHGKKTFNSKLIVK